MPSHAAFTISPPRPRMLNQVGAWACCPCFLAILRNNLHLPPPRSVVARRATSQALQHLASSLSWPLHVVTFQKTTTVDKRRKQIFIPSLSSRHIPRTPLVSQLKLINPSRRSLTQSYTFVMLVATRRTASRSTQSCSRCQTPRPATDPPTCGRSSSSAARRPAARTPTAKQKGSRRGRRGSRGKTRGRACRRRRRRVRRSDCGSWRWSAAGRCQREWFFRVGFDMAAGRGVGVVGRTRALCWTLSCTIGAIWSSRSSCMADACGR